jgi:hypothetical protein
MKGLMISIIFLGLFTGCIIPPEKKKKECPTTSQLSMLTSGVSQTATPSSHICEDVTLYRCDARVFSPDVQTSRSEEDYCFSDDNSQCIFVDTMNFSTSDQKTSDQHATDDDFKLGSQYNYSEVTCYHIDLLQDGLSKATGEGSTIDEAIKKAITNCKGLK